MIIRGRCKARSSVLLEHHSERKEFSLSMPERVESIFIEDIGMKRIPEEVMEMGRQRFSLMKVAVEKMPLGLDEAKARKFIFDFGFEALPPELVKFHFFDIRIG
ncbi:hypothetical protein NPIL_700361 [Nephila pilipes]|uniref:Uncharacterized protein n=1 Tax=Nephila pilipes TaxID=299642 RepID=A0A8X6KJM2_NEPPI|nr:hypothetical protein NPIL_700361 [Nephila pilipes]